MITGAVARLKALSPLKLALVVLVGFALVGSSTAVAKSLITGSDIKDRSVEGRDIAKSTVTHNNIRNGTIGTKDLSRAVRARISRGARAGAQGAAGKDGAAGATGATGATGGFTVRDANGTTAGPLLTLTTTVSQLPSLTFYFRGHTFSADSRTGALALPVTSFFYVQPGCTGTPYYQVVLPRQTAVRSPDTDDLRVYVDSGAVPSTRTAGSVLEPPIGGGGSDGTCYDSPFSTRLIEVTALSAGDTPPALTGPLSLVPPG